MDTEIQLDDLDKEMAGKAIKKLTRYMKKYWTIIILAIIASFITSMIAVWTPTLIGDVVDEIVKGMEPEISEEAFAHAIMTSGIPLEELMPVLETETEEPNLQGLAEIFEAHGLDFEEFITELDTSDGIDLDAIWAIARVLLIIYGIAFFLDSFGMITIAEISQILSRKLRKDMSDKIDKVPLSYFDSNKTGDTLSRVTNDVTSLGDTIDQSFLAIISSVFMLLGSLVMMFWVNWIMAFAALAGTFIGFIFMAVVGAKTQKHFKAQQEELGKITGHIEEVFSGHDVVKTTGTGEFVTKEMEEINNRLYTSSFKAQFAMSMMMSVMFFVSNLSFVFVSVVGAVLVFNGRIDFSVIVEFMIYIRLFTQPLAELAQQSMMLQTAVAASDRIFQFLEAEEMENEDHKTAKLSDVKGDVEFKDIKFSYKPDVPVIKNFTADIKAGQKIAIVGPTGAGKTTIVNLLMRFYEVDGGTIKVDGVDIKDMKQDDVHELFCMVLQDTWLFEGSVNQNIIYNNKKATQEDVVRVCKAVGLHHYIKSMPQGYDTILTDKVNLSVGQRQLMTIARAMISDAHLLILDEATSSVDTRTEVLIQQAMDKLMVGRTSFVIAHRLSTIKNADLILVMNEGDIIEMGTHNELLEAEGFYAGLYNSQFEFGEESA